jgi:hypothetical protein
MPKLQINRGDARKHYQTDRRDRLIFAGFVVLLLIAFIAAAMYMNQIDIAKEVVKAIIYLVAGGLGGYSYASQKRKKEKPDA